MTSMTQKLAAQGFRETFSGHGAGPRQQCLTALRYEKEILRRSSDPNEILVAQTSLEAYSAQTSEDAGIAILGASLEALRNGIQGPVAGELANIGKRAMSQSFLHSGKAQVDVGLAFLNAHSESEDPSVHVVAQTAKTAISKELGVGSQFSCIAATFNALAAGISGPIGSVLARIGANAITSKNIGSPVDACKLGLTYVDAVIKNSSDPEQLELAKIALESYEQAKDAYQGADTLTAFLSQGEKSYRQTRPDNLGVQGQGLFGCGSAGMGGTAT